MASNRKRKRAKSRANGKSGGAAEAGTGTGRAAAAPAAPATSKVHGKESLTAEPLINKTAPPEPRPPTKKFRGQHPQRTQLPSNSHIPLLLQHPVLSLYFPHLLLLHSFLYQALSFSSKSTSLRKLEEVVAGKGSDKDLVLLLKTSIVGLKNLRAPNAILDIEDATQSTGGSRHPSTTQSEIVDLALHTLFYRSLSTKRSNSAVYPGKPNNILAQGYVLNNHHIAAPHGLNSGLFGVDIVNLYPNAHIGTLKSPVWGRLLGIIGDEAMLDLLLNTSIFLQLEGRGDQCDVAKANYYQLAGPSLSDFLNNPVTQPVPPPPSHTSSTRPAGAGAPLKRCLSEIEGAGAKNIDKKIRPNRLRPAAASSLKLTNTTTPAITNDGKSDVKRLHSGKQELHETKTCNNNTCNNSGTASKNTTAAQRDLRTPGEIVFVRSRMFYSKPAYNGRGEVEFGLRHIHVLNRFPDPSVKSHTVQVLKYIFPRQFNLHNAFTSVIDRRETVQPLKDYTMREKEISALAALSGKPEALSVPKRLRGTVFELVTRIQKLHKRCSYHALVKYYCPVKLCDGAVQKPVTAATLANNLLTTSSDDKLATQAEISTETPVVFGPSLPPKYNDEIVKDGEVFTDFASNTSEVSAFARAVIFKVIPRGFWGKGDGNRKLIMTNVDRFVKLRRYESYSLHEIMQGLKLTEFTWLCPAGTSSSIKLCLSDARKRRELLAEFLFWLFDSFLIPLLRFHFYITESSSERNRLFYFRHDVWKKISEPTLNRLKNNTFQELKLERARILLDQRALGYAQVRLLPKINGVRPVMNLKRRALKQDKHKGKTILAPSINTILKPVHNVLVFEKSRKAERLGAAMFSVGDIYTRLKAFKASLCGAKSTLPELFFVKVDIAACFDTIPQGALVKIIESIITEPEYRLEKHAEIRPPGPAGSKKPIRRFVVRAQLPEDYNRFADLAQEEVKRRNVNRTIFVDDVVHQFQESNSLLDLLEEHIRKNIIRIGKKYYRQKNGIPQGSIVSSILCNFFYGDLENKKLSFALEDDGILMRLIDDFLYITPNREKAQKFLEIMHGGLPEYGAFVGVQKTLVNFPTTVGGVEVARLADTEEFPYCGNLLNTRTLEIRKDRGRKNQTNVNNFLTIEYSKAPGKSLHRKALGGFKMQAHPMYFDTTLNSIHTVLTNIYHNFIEAAMKLHRSVVSLRAIKSPGQPLLIKIISDLLEVAYTILQKGDFKCTIRRSQVRWLGAQAFKKVLGRKQTNYKPLLQYLDGVVKKERGDNETAAVVEKGGGIFAGYKY